MGDALRHSGAQYMLGYDLGAVITNMNKKGDQRMLYYQSKGRRKLE